MKKYVIILSFLISSIGEGRVIKQVDPIDPNKEKCLMDYLYSPLILSQGEVSLTYLNQVDKYCSCEAKSLKKYFQTVQENWIKAAFMDKSEMLSKRDSCAGDAFSSETISVHYGLRFYQWFAPQIEDKIQEVSGGSQIKMVVGEGRWNKFSTCFFDKVAKNCTKVKSLKMTHECIKKEFQGKKYDQIYQFCTPELKEPIFYGDLI